MSFAFNQFNQLGKRIHGLPETTRFGLALGCLAVSAIGLLVFWTRNIAPTQLAAIGRPPENAQTQTIAKAPEPADAALSPVAGLAQTLESSTRLLKALTARSSEDGILNQIAGFAARWAGRIGQALERKVEP